MADTELPKAVSMHNIFRRFQAGWDSQSKAEMDGTLRQTAFGSRNNAHMHDPAIPFYDSALTCVSLTANNAVRMATVRQGRCFYKRACSRKRRAPP